MLELMRGMKLDATVHGFRSSFRDWAAERAAFPHEVCELALAHTIPNAAEAAYRRRNLFEKRETFGWLIPSKPAPGSVVSGLDGVLRSAPSSGMLGTHTK